MEDTVRLDRETVEVMGVMSRTCSRCKHTVIGKITAFRWDDIRKCYVASEWQMPRGWLVIYHSIYFDADAKIPTTFSIPTTLSIAVCNDCAPEVLAFINWESGISKSP